MPTPTPRRPRVPKAPKALPDRLKSAAKFDAFQNKNLSVGEKNEIRAEAKRRADQDRRDAAARKPAILPKKK